MEKTEGEGTQYSVRTTTHRHTCTLQLIKGTVWLVVYVVLVFQEVVGKKKAEYDHGLFLKEMPSEFGPFWHHLQGLTYSDKPDYSVSTSR